MPASCISKIVFLLYYSTYYRKINGERLPHKNLLISPKMAASCDSYGLDDKFKDKMQVYIYFLIH